MKYFLQGRASARKNSPSGNGALEVKVHQFYGGTIEYLMIWMDEMLNVLSKKPCETPDSKFSKIEVFLLGEVSAN